ncbi:MAG: hypothetical protein ACKN9V_07800 [Pseudomonadota bacterium]
MYFFIKTLLLALFINSHFSLAHYAVLSGPTELFHLNEIHNELRLDESEKQESLFSGRVTAEQAAIAAIESFLTDGNDVESPLALSLGAGEDLFSHLNRSSTKIGFMFAGEAAEHGERVENNWIIELRIPSLSDHLFFAIVDRTGKNPVYNYGFN